MARQVQVAVDCADPARVATFGAEGKRVNKRVHLFAERGLGSTVRRWTVQMCTCLRVLDPSSISAVSVSTSRCAVS